MGLADDRNSPLNWLAIGKRSGTATVAAAALPLSTRVVSIGC
jgi:hypothetical protein